MTDASQGLSPLSAGDEHLLVNLLREALLLLDEDRMAARRCIESACALARGPDRSALPTNNLLADWQVRRVQTHIRANLGTSLRIEAVAGLVHLSGSYFSRAFKATTKISYAKFVMRERIELAKRLLLTTQRPISEIALTCGLADQSHLTRLFGKSEGLPPKAWRRCFAGDVVETAPSSTVGANILLQPKTSIFKTAFSAPAMMVPSKTPMSDAAEQAFARQSDR